MNFAAKNEVELEMVQLLKKQQENKKMNDAIEVSSLNWMIILMMPMLLVSIEVVLKIYGLDTELMFYGMLTFILLLIIRTNERIDKLHKLLLNQI